MRRVSKIAVALGLLAFVSCRSPLVDSSEASDNNTFHNPSYVYASSAHVSESSDNEASFDYMKKQTLGYIYRLKKHHGKRWGKIERIYSGATVNEEQGLGIVLYKLKEADDKFYVVAANSDRIITSGKGDKFQIVGDIVLSTSLDDLLAQLEICYQNPRNIQGLKIDRNIRLNLKDGNEVMLYVGAPYHEEEGYGSLKYSIKVKKVDEKIYVSGQGNGKYTVEDFLE